MRRLLLILLVAVLPGCAYIHMEVAQEEPVKVTPKKNLMDQLPVLDRPPMTVAVPLSKITISPIVMPLPSAVANYLEVRFHTK